MPDREPTAVSMSVETATRRLLILLREWKLVAHFGLVNAQDDDD